MIEKKFGDYYTLEYDEIEKDIGLTSMTFVIKNPEFKTDTTDEEGMKKYPILFFDATELRIENMSTWDVIWGSHVNLTDIILDDPQLDIYSRKRIEKESSKVENRVGKALLSSIESDFFQINNGRVNVYDFVTKSLIMSNDDIEIDLKKPTLDLDHLDDIHKAFQFQDVEINSSQSKFAPLGSIYTFTLDSLQLQSVSNFVDLKHIEVSTQRSLKEESYDQPNQTEVINMDIGKIGIVGLQLDELIYNNKVDIRKIVISQSEIEIFKNLMTNMDDDFHKYVMNENLRKIPIPFDIDSIILKKSDLKFRLMNSKYVEPAQLDISEINGSLAHFNNINKKDTLQLSFNGQLMNVGQLDFHAAIPIHDAINNYQSFRGTLGPMNFKYFNPIIQHFVNIKVREGEIDQLSFTGECNSTRSKGTVSFAYSDLKIDVYSLKDKSVRKKNKFLSFISGLAFYKNHPTDTRPLTPKTFYFVKQKHQGSVMMWVGGIIDGMMKTTLKEFIRDKV